MSDWQDILAFVLRLGVGGLIVYVAYLALFGGRADFVIHFRDGRVDSRGRIPLALRGALAELFADDLSLTGPVTVSGYRRGNRLDLRFRGDLSEGARQRIRNFLVSRLRL